MNKKVIALILSCVLFVSASPVVAAEDTPVKPTVEEILNEYHQKAFEAQSAEKTGTATTYSNRSGSKTLEQETVDTLNAAGYEAYNVTASNYKALEADLKTDFASMGLDPNGSYIVVISGEDPDNTNNTRAIGDNLITPTPEPGEDTDPSYFTHIYNGNAYNMRYVTVTATQNDELGQLSDPIDLLDKYDVDDFAEDLDVPITILSTLGLLPYTGTVYSILSPILFYTDANSTSSLTYRGATNWTITYIQVYNFSKSAWYIGYGVEYVTMKYFIDYTYYSSASNQYEDSSFNGIYDILYSEHYNDKAFMKDQAAYAYDRGGYLLDEITFVEYKFKSESILKHYRPFPELYYIPE